MTDRELLELAAKAAGQERSAAGDLWSNARGALWNPLTDDGDALRLAVKLEISWDGTSSRCWAFAYGKAIDGACEESYNADPYAATRRAIVRAAAAIGEAMQ